MSIADVFDHIEGHLDESIATLSEFCRIPSISAEKKAQPEAPAFVRLSDLRSGAKYFAALMARF